MVEAASQRKRILKKEASPAVLKECVLMEGC